MSFRIMVFLTNCHFPHSKSTAKGWESAACVTLLPSLPEAGEIVSPLSGFACVRHRSSTLDRVTEDVT